jgi:two-component sensor histidine kinase
MFTGISIAGKRYPLAPLGASRVSEVTLNPDQNHVEIEFAAPGGDSGGAIHYRVRLQGADSGWSVPQTENRVDYHQLMAGSYRFLVKSLDSDGTESASIAEFDFRILPPVWRRWWFESPAAFLFLIFAYWLHTRRLGRLLAIERVRAGIASDLHDDIGASLARISVLSEVARLQMEKDTGLARAQLARIGSAASEMLESMNDIVWSVRASDARVESLVERMRDFAMDVLGPAGIEFTLACDARLQENKLPGEARRQLLLIFKECVHNISKHSACREVRVELAAAGGKMTMTVSDDGCGPRGASGGRGNGVPSMTRRARSLGGEIEIGERAGGGCCVTLRIPTPAR